MKCRNKLYYAELLQQRPHDSVIVMNGRLWYNSPLVQSERHLHTIIYEVVEVAAGVALSGCVVAAGLFLCSAMRLASSWISVTCLAVDV